MLKYQIHKLCMKQFMARLRTLEKSSSKVIDPKIYFKNLSQPLKDINRSKLSSFQTEATHQASCTVSCTNFQHFLQIFQNIFVSGFAIINFKITDSLTSSLSFCITQPGFFCSKGNELRCLVRQEVTVVPCYRACDLEKL